jgi:3-deoxy-D-manno-octulosonic-acid transferase
MGPHTFNFAEAALQSELYGATIRVQDVFHAWVVTLDLLQNSKKHTTMKKAALDWISVNRGAALKLIENL